MLISKIKDLTPSPLSLKLPCSPLSKGNHLPPLTRGGLEGLRRGVGGEVSVQVIPIPGPSAVIAALSASGLLTHEFTFLGFLPHKKGRETLFKEIAESKRTMVFYESPHRILKTLESLIKFCPNKKVCLAREITKIYEEFKTDSPDELLEYLTKNPIKQKGEFTLLIA
jgi:16S rRNA (cytidine1402-2'-O)-methyltransferase